MEECSHLTQLLETVCASPESGIVVIGTPLVSPATERGVCLEQKGSICEVKACRSSEDTVVGVYASILVSSAMS